MNFHIITIFPEMFDSYLQESILGRAIKEKKIKIKFYNSRDFIHTPKNNYKPVDDKPYGGGPGMVMRAEPILKAVEKAIKASKGKTQIIITELPYQVNKAELVAKIAELVKDKKVVGIADLRDESDKDGMRVAIDLKRDAKPKSVLNNIYKHISKYEMTRILGFRSQQIAEGSPIYVEIPQDVIDPLEIAILEYNLGLIPVLLIREYNNEKPGETIETINTLDSLIKFNPLY